MNRRLLVNQVDNLYYVFVLVKIPASSASVARYLCLLVSLRFFNVILDEWGYVAVTSFTDPSDICQESI